jgi:Predicted membrane protein
MRTFRDRIRHALSFEIIGLLVVTPLGAWAFRFPLHDIGLVALVSATIATAWNFAYNYLFDLTRQRIAGTTAKSGLVRVLHAVLFELGLLALLMPFIAWYLDISLWQAFVMDLSFALFYMLYAYAFNLAYDRLFPLAEWKDFVGSHEKARGFGHG